jgi:hypothetical protein
MDEIKVEAPKARWSESGTETRIRRDPGRTAHTVRLMRSQLMRAKDSPDTKQVAEAVLREVERADEHMRGLSQTYWRVYWTVMGLLLLSLLALFLWLASCVLF